MQESLLLILHPHRILQEVEDWTKKCKNPKIKKEIRKTHKACKIMEELAEEDVSFRRIANELKRKARLIFDSLGVIEPSIKKEWTLYPFTSEEEIYEKKFKGDKKKLEIIRKNALWTKIIVELVKKLKFYSRFRDKEDFISADKDKKWQWDRTKYPQELFRKAAKLLHYCCPLLWDYSNRTVDSVRNRFAEAQKTNRAIPLKN